VASTLASGKCITYRDSKTNYAVVIAIGEKTLLVARGTKESKWSETGSRYAEPVEPRSAQARRWFDPPITQTTYFYDFYIQVIERATIDIVVHGFCERTLWEAIRVAAQQKVREFQTPPSAGPSGG
jgi:hypothetical protein